MSLMFCFFANLIWNLIKVVGFYLRVGACEQTEWSTGNVLKDRGAEKGRASGLTNHREKLVESGTRQILTQRALSKGNKGHVKNITLNYETHNVSKRQIRQCYCNWAFISAARKNKKFHIGAQHYFYVDLDNSCLSYWQIPWQEPDEQKRLV